MTVLVLAQELDRIADGVIQGLTDLGEQVMRVDLSWFPQQLTGWTRSFVTGSGEDA